MITALFACTALSFADPGPVRYVQTLELPTHSEGFHDWPSDEISAIEFIPNQVEGLNITPSFFIVPDDRSQAAPARIGRIEMRPGEQRPEFSGIRWLAFRDEKGRTFEKNTVDPEAVRILGRTEGPGGRVDQSWTVIWTSEGYGRAGLDPAIYVWGMDKPSSQKWMLPEAFRYDDPVGPMRGIVHNRGFESLAIDHWGPVTVVYAAVERPLLQDRGTDICRVLVRSLRRNLTQQLGYLLGPGSEGTDPDTLAVAELLSVGPSRLLVLENAELPDGETVSRLWWASTDGATDLTAIDSMKDPGDHHPRLIEKKLLLDFATLPNNEGLGNFEGMDERDGRLYLVEDNEHGKTGFTRMLVLKLPSGLRD